MEKVKEIKEAEKVTVTDEKKNARKPAKKQSVKNAAPRIKTEEKPADADVKRTESQAKIVEGLLELNKTAWKVLHLLNAALTDDRGTDIE